MKQPIETLEEFQELQRVDLSYHEPLIIDTDDDEDEDAMEAFDQSH